MEEKEKMKKEIIAIFVWFILIGMILISAQQTPTKKIGMFVKVDDYTGFNTNTDALYFGTVMPNGQSVRIINITNLGNDSLVSIKIQGELKKWVEISKNNFNLKTNETEPLQLKINIPKNAKFDNYSGELEIYFKDEV